MADHSFGGSAPPRDHFLAARLRITISSGNEGQQPLIRAGIARVAPTFATRAALQQRLPLIAFDMRGTAFQLEPQEPYLVDDSHGHRRPRHIQLRDLVLGTRRVAASRSFLRSHPDLFPP